MELVTGKFQWISRHLYNFQFTLFQQKKQPDIVAGSNSKKSVLLIELTAPWEENWEEAYEWEKKNDTRHLVPTVSKRVGYTM